MEAVRWSTVELTIGTVGVGTTDAGLLTICLPAERAGRDRALARRAPAARLIDADGRNRAVEQQLKAYDAGELRAFDLPLDQRGTAFQRAVWAAVAAVPYGATSTYGDVARAIESPTAFRAVGAANGDNSLPIVIPCHRIVGGAGQLTGYGGGLPTKLALLRLEGALPRVGEGWADWAERQRDTWPKLVLGLRSTGIYCRPSCPALARITSVPRRFNGPAAAEAAGFRACRRCRST